MRVVKKKTIVEYFAKHPDAKVALEDWYEKAANAKWGNYADLRRTFGSADNVGGKRIVFNIKGNDYRLVAIVLYRIGMIYVRFIGTHSEYSRLSKEQIVNI